MPGAGITRQLLAAENRPISALAAVGFRYGAGRIYRERRRLV